jgi:lipoate---protein ligase
MPDTPLNELIWPKSLICYDITLATDVQNLALDEALLAEVEADPKMACLRIWEPTEHLVVLGRSNRAESEVNVEFCKAERIPILRRSSGGGTVLLGPGCLCYTLALPLTETHRALGIARVTTDLMERTAAGLRTVLPGVFVQGTSDLVWDGRKFSGNAQRWLRKSFIHHGTLLYNFDLTKLSRALAHPSRQPDYRKARPHSEFVTNLAMDTISLRRILCKSWNATPSECHAKLMEETRKIAQSRYSSSDWKL